ncbi:MAG: asparagine synthase-related protein [Planctomycetota bacterium]
MSALFGFSGPPDPALAGRMAEALSHRGRQPVELDVGREGTIAFRALHESDAGLWRTSDRTLAIAGQIFEEDGEKLLEEIAASPERINELRGFFVLVYRDGDHWRLMRDGAGRRTIYWALHEERLRFAIEPKGILAAPSFPRRIRPAAIAQYLAFSFVPGSGTMLEGVHELPAGHVLHWRAGDTEVRLERVFQPEKCGRDQEDDPEFWIERFREEHARAVSDLRSVGTPYGVFLSGGIDSSIVTAEVARQTSGKVRTYAIHFGRKYPNELEHARAVAVACGTDHEEVEIHPKHFLPELRGILWHLDDPIGDPVTVPNFALAQHASREVRFIFNGEGGDPCFGGPKNIPMLLHHWYGLARDEGFRERRYLESYRRAYEELPRLLTPEWRAQFSDEDLEGVLRPYLSEGPPSSFLDKLTTVNIREKGAHLILPKVERMLAAAGLTPLSPLFDERLVELSFRMPSRLRLDRGIEKVVLKRAYEDVIPPSIIERPKSGMRVPVHFWCQGELKHYLKKILSPKEVRRVGIFRPERVQQLLAYDTEEGPGRYGLRLWMLMTFEIWRRLVIDREPL